MRYKNSLLDEENFKKRVGFDLVLKDRYQTYLDAADYFLKTMESSPLDVSYDVTAGELPFFRTVNYTTYIDGILLKPLSADIARISIVEALADNCDDGIDYQQHIANKVINNDASKYINKLEVAPADYACEALVVLPGHNKFNAICIEKLRWISEQHGKLAVFKPHPLTDRTKILELKRNLHNHSTVLSINDDLYHYLQKASIVYTSHLSESAVYAKALGKKISPIDAIQMRTNQTYSHINDILFMTNIPNVINKIFSSYKSGVIMPDIQPDWKERIEKYVDYMNAQRDMCKNYYTQPYTSPNIPDDFDQEQAPFVKVDRNVQHD